jgi:biopolymer transport protein ExbB
MEIFSLIKEGGFVMYPLIICSLVIWTVILERFWGLMQFNREYKAIHQKAVALLKDKKREEAKGLFGQANKLIAGPHLPLFEAQPSREVMEGKIARRMSETQSGLRKFLWILGTIGASAPFIGLFGTVIGIIQSFENISSSGKSGFPVVAKGLSEALVATASGIFVAVVAVMFYNYFQVRVKNINLEFKNKLQDLRDLLD